MNCRVIYLPGAFLSFHWLALILSQLAIQDPEFDLQSSVIGFVKRYTGPWPSRKLGWVDFFPPGAGTDDRRANLIQYHLCVFSPSRGEPSFDSLEGIRCHRGSGSLPSFGGETITPFIERRFSVALDTSLVLELPTFVLVTLSDSEDTLFLSGQGKSQWSDEKLLPCLQRTGVTVFQYQIYRPLNLWANEWNRLLDSIDKALTAEVGPHINCVKNILFTAI